MGDYRILRREDPDELAQIVKTMMGRGWVPQGGVALLHTRWDYGAPREITWAQAMVKDAAPAGGGGEEG